jgi:hypothetical protein
MKLTSLTIAPKRQWSDINAGNPLIAVVKLQSENSTVECVLSDESMRKMLDLCAAEISAAAERNVRDFVAAVSAIESGKSAAVLPSA